LLTYAATDWQDYLTLFSQLIAAGGFFLFVMVTSWIFGREFADGTVKDFLAVPVRRTSIVLAKFVTAAAWCGMLALMIFAAGLATGLFIRLPGGSTVVIFNGGSVVLKSSLLTIWLVLPFAFFASAGRGYLLPIGLAVLALMMANLSTVLGWGEYFPWAIPGLMSMGTDALSPASPWIVLLTGLVGILATLLWGRLPTRTARRCRLPPIPAIITWQP
jgi:ABC-2 type transport system permease protein